MALVRFYSRRDNSLLFFGSAFLGTALLDGFHTAVTSTFFSQLFPSSLDRLIPWSWVASRLFLGVFLLLSWLVWRKEVTLGERDRISARTVYAIVGLSTVVAFLFFWLVPLPAAYYPGMTFRRPAELLPAVVLLPALIGYLHKGPGGTIHSTTGWSCRSLPGS